MPDLPSAMQSREYSQHEGHNLVPLEESFFTVSLHMQTHVREELFCIQQVQVDYCREPLRVHLHSQRITKHADAAACCFVNNVRSSI